MVNSKLTSPGLSVTALTRIVREIYPNAAIKRLGKKRVSCIVGITQCTNDPRPSSLISSPQPESDTAALVMELQRERQRRLELESEVRELRQSASQKYSMSAADYQRGLQLEIESVPYTRQLLFHGPDTVERFKDFSMGGIIDELKTTCPEMYKLMQKLGNTQTNAVPGSVPDEELKCVMATCTLLNAHSARVNGLQLMMSLMMVARSISRQVYLYILVLAY